MTEMLPILAHGETYAQAIVKRGVGAPKPRPHEYEEARERLISNIDTVLMQIDVNPDLYLDEKIVCIRMEPKFEAKSYTPSSILTVSNDMKLVGGRKYKIAEKKEASVSSNEVDSNHPEYAKLYFLRATTADLTDFRKSLRDGLNTTESWRNEIMSLHSIDILSPGEKILGFDDEWKNGLVEAVLHPLKEDESEEAINLFCKKSGLDRSEIEVRSYKDGVTFIAAKLSREAAAAVARINPLRTVHPMGRICLEPIRRQMSSPAPKIQQAHGRAPVTIGVFDGGCADVPLLHGRVTFHDCVPSAASQNGIDHGSGVCGAILHGELSGKRPEDILPEPVVHVESFRVLPPSDPEDFDLYESIDAIEYVVATNPEIPLYNLSFGPHGPILEDDISRFTYALDQMLLAPG